MFTVDELDSYVTHDDQIQEADGPDDGPVVLVNIFHVDPDHGDELTEIWAGILRRFKSSPGWISAQFHRGTAGSGTFLNYSIWESAAHYRAAYSNPDFRDMLPAYPDGAVATPHLFTKVAIAGVCTR